MLMYNINTYLSSNSISLPEKKSVRVGTRISNCPEIRVCTVVLLNTVPQSKTQYFDISLKLYCKTTGNKNCCSYSCLKLIKKQLYLTLWFNIFFKSQSWHITGRKFPSLQKFSSSNWQVQPSKLLFLQQTGRKGSVTLLLQFYASANYSKPELACFKPGMNFVPMFSISEAFKLSQHEITGF